MTFNAQGDEFNAKHFVSQFISQHEYIELDNTYPNCLSFKHPDEFSKEYFDEDYENYFLFLIQNNIETLKSFGATDFDLFIDVYYSDQCNFEILNPKFFYYLNNYKIRLPISVYHIPQK